VTLLSPTEPADDRIRAVATRELAEHRIDGELFVSVIRSERGTPEARINKSIVELLVALQSAPTVAAAVKALSIVSSQLAPSVSQPGNRRVKLGSRAVVPAVAVSLPRIRESNE
jgi:hypothetical protein